MINYSNEFLLDYCNWGNKKTFIISIDVDFVPDFILEDSINLINENKIYSTVFITHPTMLVDRMLNLEYTEVGIHPNVNRGSTQKGQSKTSKINNLVNYSLNAKSSKFHLLGYNLPCPHKLDQY